jgi:hypothetical protein
MTAIDRFGRGDFFEIVYAGDFVFDESLLSLPV